MMEGNDNVNPSQGSESTSFCLPKSIQTGILQLYVEFPRHWGHKANLSIMGSAYLPNMHHEITPTTVFDLRSQYSFSCVTSHIKIPQDMHNDKYSNITPT